MSKERGCRKCGCTETRACVTDGVACHWVEEDLCSACAAPAASLQSSDIDALHCQPTFVLELGGVQALVLLATLQVAMRHTEFEHQAEAHNFILDLAHTLAAGVGVTPNLKAVCESGWPKPEETPAASQSSLILPPGYQ